jgi:predicted O-linked N-acetylglucosamine transferase (SPINDLY family)
MLGKLLQECWNGLGTNRPPVAATKPPTNRGQQASAATNDRSNNTAETEAAFCRRLDSDPQDFEALLALSRLYEHSGRNTMALEVLRRATAVRPDSQRALIMLANLCAMEGLTEEAESCYQRALCLRPGDPGLLLKLATLLPAVVESDEHIRAVRERLQTRLDELLSQPRPRQPVRLIASTCFFLAYHGLNDRDLQVKIARTYDHLFPLRHTAPHCQRVGTPGGRRRVGFLSAFFYNHSVGVNFLPIIRALARDPDLDLVLIAMGGKEDELTRQAVHACAEYVRVTQDLATARAQVAELALDVLVYTDIGMEPLSYLLAFSRLAPVQCVLGGHPVTTGIQTMDYFISGRLTEGPGAREHYSEELVELSSWPVVMPRFSVPQTMPSRTELGLSRYGRLYICPVKLQKIHPQFDRALLHILQRDVDGRVVLFGDRDHAAWQQTLMQRLRRNLGPTMQRVHMQPWCDGASFLAVLTSADVVLDPFHFGLGTTAFMAFAVGTPVVTYPPQFLRGRTSLACYRKMGIDDCIAQNPDDYVRLAVQVATNPNLREALRKRILARNNRLYGDFSSSAELAEFLRTVEPRPRPS